MGVVIGSQTLARVTADLIAGKHKGPLIESLRREVRGAKWRAWPAACFVMVSVETFDGKRKTMRLGSATSPELFEVRITVELYYWLARVAISRVLS